MYIDAHNSQWAAGKFSFNLGVNEFSDLTHAEFKALYLGPKLPEDGARGNYSSAHRVLAPDRLRVKPCILTCWRLHAVFIFFSITVEGVSGHSVKEGSAYATGACGHHTAQSSQPCMCME